MDMKENPGWREWMETLEIPVGDEAERMVSSEIMRRRWEAGRRDDDSTGIMPRYWYDRPLGEQGEFSDALTLKSGVDLGQEPLYPSDVNFAAHLFGARTGLPNARWLLKRHVGLDCRLRVRLGELAAFLGSARGEVKCDGLG